MVALGAVILAGVAASPAQAVVGGEAAVGPLARATVMVLSSRGGVCSGIVLAPDVVLTAGHCAAAADEHRVHYKGPDGAPVLIVPQQIVRHPGYEPGAVATRRRSIDLALLRLPDPVPASFAAAALASATPAKGAALTVGGYGVAREGDARSTGTFRTASLRQIEPHGPSRILLWASDPAKAGAGACTGDSGGPVAADDGAIAAVSTWASGSSGRACGEVSQAVLVAPQRAWIDGTVAAWGRQATWR